MTTPKTTDPEEIEGAATLEEKNEVRRKLREGAAQNPDDSVSWILSRSPNWKHVAGIGFSLYADKYSNVVVLVKGTGKDHKDEWIVTDGYTVGHFCRAQTLYELKA